LRPGLFFMTQIPKGRPMNVPRAAERLRDSFVRYYHEVSRPHECPFCEGDRIWWNGSRTRGATAEFEDRVVTVDSFPCRRVRCAECRTSWTLLPPDLLPGRQVGLAVATRALERYLFEEEASLESCAKESSISARTLGRIRDWIARLVSPSLLQGLVVECCAEPIPGLVHPVVDLARKGKDPERRSLLGRAAQVLCLAESLASAAGLLAPGLASLVSRAVRGRRDRALYHGSLPEKAWRQAVGLPGTMAM
jgi:hypothetical protein